MATADLERRIRILEARLERSTKSRATLEDRQALNDELVRAKILEMAGIQTALELRHTELQAVHRQLLDSEQRAQDANAAKSQFLATMSHELRTPLNAIIGYAELLEEELAEGEISNEQMTADLGKIRVSGRHLLSLVNDILDLSKIEARQYRLCLMSVDVTKIVETAVVNALPGIRTNGNSFESDIQEVGEVVTDAQALSQCVINLLSNAGKFTRDGKVKLRLYTQASGIRIDVQDTGIGMTLEQSEGVFAAFAQADASTSRKYGGTGLGLSISRHLIGLLGGVLTVTSKLGVGSTFSAYIPSIEMA